MKRVAVVALAVLLLAAPLISVSAVPATAAGQPPGMVGIPDDNVSSPLPDRTPMGEAAQKIADAGVMTTKHADTLEVVVTTPGRAKQRTGTTIQGTGPIAIVLTDDVHDQGRRVALPRDELVAVLGYVPRLAYGTHDDGSTWSTPTTVTSDWVIVRVPHFSTNTITFSGTIEINGNPATDGSSYSYDVNTLDSVNDFTASFTGFTATEDETRSVNQLGDGSRSISVAGNAEPTGSATGDSPTLTVTSLKYKRSWEYDGGSGTSIPHSETFPSGSQTLTKVEVDIYNSLCDESLSYQFDVTVKTNGTTKTSTVTMSEDDSFCNEDTATLTYSIQSDDQIKVTVDNANTTDIQLDGIRVYGGSPNEVTVSTASASKTVSGLSAGESKSVPFNVSTSDTSLDVTVVGETKITLNYTERTKTTDPKLEVNGHWANYTGTLTDGESVSLSVDPAWIQEGSNTVNVHVGDGTLSTDAPTPSVTLDYDHQHVDNASVDYQSEEWSERYNVSKTYASEQSQAELTIPFESSAVVAVRTIDYRINESGGWTSVASSAYSFTDTTLTVDLDAVYGGAIPAGTTLEIRANGTKVQVSNGSITVLDPSGPSEEYDIKIRLDSWGSDAYIDTSGASKRIHYTYNEDWDSPDERFKVTASGGHRLIMPGAGAGDTTRIATIPVTATPASNEVIIKVSDPTSSEPEFRVLPGATTGDTVEFTFVGADDGKTYILYSKTHNKVRDKGTANSPLTLEDDDSDELLKFRLSSGGGGAGGGVAPMGGSGVAAALGAPLTILSVAAGLIAVWFVSRRFGGAAGTTTQATGLTRVPVVGGVLASGVRLVSGSPLVLFGLVGMLGVAGLRFGVITVSEQVQGVLAIMVGFGGVAYALWRLGRLTLPLLSVLGTLAFVAVAELINPGSILGPLGSGLGQATILLVIVVGALGWRYLQNREGPRKVNRIIISDDDK